MTSPNNNDGHDNLRYKNQVFPDFESLSTNPLEAEAVAGRSYSLSTTPETQVATTHSESSLSTVTASLVENIPIISSEIVPQPRETEEQLRRQLQEAKDEIQRIRRQQELATPAIPEDITTASSPIEVDSESLSEERSRSGSVQRRRTQGTAILGSLCVAIVLSITIVLALSPSPPIDSHQYTNRTTEISELINSVTFSDRLVIYDPESQHPKDEALVWLIDTDPMNLTIANRSKLIQRFVLLSLWFEQGLGALPIFPQADECLGSDLWRCNENGEIHEVFMVRKGLTGTIPQDIGLLTALYSLNIGNNAVSGTLPSQIGKLTDLAYLLVNGNILKGTLPTELGLLDNMAFLWFEHNQFTGAIPSTLANLPRLHEALFHNNPGITGNMSICERHDSVFEPAETLILAGGNLVADCDRVGCPCCTHCCPNSTRDGTPYYGEACHTS